MLTSNTILQNRYLIIRQLGQGGMGTVYEAIDQRFDCKVALKEAHFNDEALRKQFEREARLLNRLRHPAMTRVVDHFSENDCQFLVMDYVAGEELGELLQNQSGAFSVDKVLEWADQLLDALNYLHKQDPPITHRDIKPQNLKLSDTGQVILLDFGLAKGFPGQLSRVTTSDSIFGYTPSYAPLEQIQGTGTDPRSDLYSLAATLYHLLTGVILPNVLTRLNAITEGQPDPLRSASDINPQVQVDVANVLNKALSIARSQRFNSADEMRKALNEAQHSEIIDGEGIGFLPTITSPAPTESAATVVMPPTKVAATTGDVLLPSGQLKMVRGRIWRAIPKTGWLILAVILLSSGAVLIWFQTRSDPLVEMRKKELEREISFLSSRPTSVIRKEPADYKEVERLNPIDISPFKILTDSRVVDLRMWKDVPTDKLNELYSAVVMTRQIRLKKVKEVSEYEAEARTSGLDVYWYCLSPYSFHVVGLKGDVFVGQDRMKARRLVIDVSNIPVDTEFELNMTATYWNSLQTQQEQWFGVIGYEGAFKISMLLLFPRERPFKDFRMMTARTVKDQPVPHNGPRIILTGERQAWLYWEVPNPEDSRVYQLHWDW